MANEPEADSPAKKPPVKKFMYKSPLSGIRSSSYKPPIDKSGFKPIGVSSPKRPNDQEVDRFAIITTGPQQSKPTITENDRCNEHGPDLTHKQTGGSPVVNEHALRGRGGHWRGPHGNMTPDSRRRGGRRQGYISSPNIEGNSGHWFSPIQNVDSSNEHSLSHNSFVLDSFGSNLRTPGSSYGQNSSKNSPLSNSRRNNRGRGSGRGRRNNGAIEAFYSPSMKEDPWSRLMRERLNASCSGNNSKSLLNMTSDSDLDEGISSQGNDTPIGDDST